ncbi:MAG: DUF4422 domain-containing protein [Rikenellaceae bacterium]
MTRIKILVCTHKKSFLKSDDIYTPIHVGAEGSDLELNILKDNTGDNISAKNYCYCELTAQYWAWKNLKDVDYIGLCHYRRYFNFYKRGTSFCYYTLIRDEIDSLNLDVPNISTLFSKHDIVLAKPMVSKYSLHVGYCLSHFSKDIRIIEQIIAEKHPQYTHSVKHILHNCNRLSPYNMYIMKWSEFDKYCNWLFPILKEAEARIDISNYDDAQKRVYGYLAERLLNLYVYHNKMNVKYYPIYWLEKNEKLSNISRRVWGFLRRSIAFFFNKSYSIRKTK